MKILLLFILLTNLSFSLETPKDLLTPGYLCSKTDKDFKVVKYRDNIAICKRNVSLKEKRNVAISYGNIKNIYWVNYEFDHLIPLCAGGSNNIKNIWLQRLSEAHKKDVLENDVCRGIRKGTMTQAEAVLKIHKWFVTNIKTP